jgi:hypothetical protein
VTPEFSEQGTAPQGPETPAQRQSPLARAKAAVAQESPEPVAPRRQADDSAVSTDDEDIEAAGEVGPAVIERLLGGQVISSPDR